MMQPSHGQNHYVECEGQWYGIPAAWVDNVTRAGFVVASKPLKPEPSDAPANVDNSKE
jgi:hypothetical protein